MSVCRKFRNSVCRPSSFVAIVHRHPSYIISNYMSEKNITKMNGIWVWYNIASLIFSQNVYLINTHILIYRHATCNCKLCKAYDFIAFFWDFHTLLTSIVIDYLSINAHILVCQHAKCDCMLWNVVVSF